MATNTTNHVTSHRGFTLIEILVVTAIIAILSALISAVTMSVIRSAKDAKCVSNLSQLNMAAEMYAIGNDGYWPPTGMTIFGDPLMTAKLMKASLGPFGAVNAIFFCPLDPYAGMSGQGNLLFAEPETSYTEDPSFLFAGHILTTWPNIVSLVSSTGLADPSRCATFSDNVYYEVPSDRNTPWTSAHGSRFNAVFADGHVKGAQIEMESNWMFEGCREAKVKQARAQE